MGVWVVSRAKLARKAASRRRKVPSIAACRAEPSLWQERIAAIWVEIQRSEKIRKHGEQREAYWRSLHRQTLALAANGGK